MPVGQAVAGSKVNVCTLSPDSLKTHIQNHVYTIEVIDDFFVGGVYVAYAGLRLLDLLQCAQLSCQRRNP